MNAAEIKQVIKKVERNRGVGGTFFSAINLKADKTMRIWNCRLGVTKHLRGGKPSYNAEERNHITVWDRKQKAYRQLNVNSLISLRVCGHTLVSFGKPTLLYKFILNEG